MSVEQALQQYRLFKRGESNIRNVERRKMFAEIFVRFEQLMRETQSKLFMYDAMCKVLSQPAPSFYLNDTSAILFYYTARRRKKQKAKNKC
jgi:hypothetical protein